MMNDFYCCQHCGKESYNEEDFKTDIDCGDDLSEMTCEQCYDDLDAMND